jgi:LmbE family N-acetylglucosaminyl deacetylase
VVSNPDEGVERVLVVTAHPDDVDFSAAGSVASWTDAGIEVTYCICTSGEAGGSDRSMTRIAMAELREEEQRKAGNTVGVKDIVFLGHPDGRLEPTLELRRDISRVIRRFRPQRVLTQSPEHNFQRIYANHPDHLAAGAATLAAVYPDARNPFAHPELLDEGWEPWSVTEVYLMTALAPDTFVDITNTVERKLNALKSHVSQTAPDGLDRLIRDWAAANASVAGWPDGKLAEAFIRIDAA